MGANTTGTQVRRTFEALDAYMAALIQAALDAATPQERAAVLQTGIALTRRLSPTALQAWLLTAMKRGDAPRTLAELAQAVQARRAGWPKVVKQPARLAAATRTRANRSSERMFAVADVAQELGVSTAAVMLWCTRGWLHCEDAASGQPRIPNSALFPYRAAQPRWKRVESLAAAALDGAPPPDEATVFADLAARRGSP